MLKVFARESDKGEWVRWKDLPSAPRPIYGAVVDEVPTLTLEPHEITEEYTPEEVVAMWDALKRKYEVAVEALRRIAFDDGFPNRENAIAEEALREMEETR